MDRDETYIKVYRKCLNNPMFRQKPYDKWHAWEYLILNARSEPTDIMVGNETIHLERGQLFRSYSSLASEFGWSEKQVRNFIAKQKVSKSLATIRHSKGQTLTIENYEFYQGEGQSKGQSKGNQKALKGQQRKNDKECIKNEKDIYSRVAHDVIDYLNEKLGTSYRATTRATYDSIKARVNEGFDTDAFFKVIDNKYADWHGTEWEKFLRPQTLFGTKFESYLNEKPRKSKSSNPFIDMLEGGIDE